MRHARVAPAAAAVLLAVLPIAAMASLGTGVGASPITLAQPANPGHSYQLPLLYVVNTGTEAAYYQVRVQAIGKPQGHPVPAGWVQFGVNHFLLQPKGAASVPMTLTIPGDAALGDYHSYLVAGTVPANQSGGVAFGAAAGTRLAFSVVAASTGFAIPWPWPWWIYLLVGLFLLVGGGVVALRGLGLGLSIEHRGTGRR